MKIFQPIVSGSFTTSGSVFLKGLTSAAQSNVVIIDTATGQLYTTASSALGGGGGTGDGFPYTGSAQITGSLTVTGSLNVTQGITGSLFGTASYAVSGGLTLQQVTANGATTTNAINIDTPDNTSGLTINCYQDYSNGIGINTISTAISITPIIVVDENRTLFSVDLNGDLFANSISTGNVYANSFAKNGGLATEYLMADGSVTSGGGGSAFPYTGTAVITGSLVVTSTLQLDGSLTDYASVTSTIVGSNNLYTQATGSYTSAFVKYTVSKGTNSRAGEFIANWNGTSVTYFGNSTTDIGSTSDIVFSSAIVSSQIQVNATAASSGWKLKTLATFI